MADNKDVDDSGSEESSAGKGGSPDSELNSNHQTAAAIPGESGEEEEEEGGENQTSSSTDNLSRPNSDQEAVDIIFRLRRVLKGKGDAPPDDQERRTTPRGAASRHFPPDSLCFMKKLTLIDASHGDGKLDIEPIKAVWIPTCPRIPEEAHDLRKSVELMVFDYENKQYNMELTGFNYEGIVLYSIQGEWRKFVRDHNLQHGDWIFFYRNKDRRINPDDFYYVILFARQSDGDFHFNDDSGRNDEC